MRHFTKTVRLMLCIGLLVACFITVAALAKPPEDEETLGFASELEGLIGFYGSKITTVEAPLPV